MLLRAMEPTPWDLLLLWYRGAGEGEVCSLLPGRPHVDAVPRELLAKRAKPTLVASAAVQCGWRSTKKQARAFLLPLRSTAISPAEIRVGLTTATPALVFSKSRHLIFAQGSSAPAFVLSHSRLDL